MASVLKHGANGLCSAQGFTTGAKAVHDILQVLAHLVISLSNSSAIPSISDAESLSLPEAPDPNETYDPSESSLRNEMKMNQQKKRKKECIIKVKELTGVLSARSLCVTTQNTPNGSSARWMKVYA